MLMVGKSSPNYDGRSGHIIFLTRLVVLETWSWSRGCLRPVLSGLGLGLGLDGSGLGLGLERLVSDIFETTTYYFDYFQDVVNGQFARIIHVVQ